MKRISILLCVLLTGTYLTAQDTVNYRPNVHGTVRAKYEYQPDLEAGRFQVRNARVSMDGMVHRMLGYKAEIDLSDAGKLRMLDAYVLLKPWQRLRFTIGQMRVPFAIDSHRSPHLQYFANRSFIAKQVGDVRDVGTMLGYTFWPEGRSLTLEGGLFNGSGITDQTRWSGSLNYALKAQYRPLPGLNVVLSTQLIRPDTVCIRLYDAGVSYDWRRWHFEVEYLFKHYAHRAFTDVNAVDAFVCYGLPLKRVFRRISFLARYDYMTDHSYGKELLTVGQTDEGVPVRRFGITDYARQRVTGGVTLSLALPFEADIRLNYEKYMYHADGIPKESEQDKLVMEFMVHF